VHVSPDRIADYLAGLLGESDEAEVESHLFSCRPCAVGVEPLFGLAASIRKAVPSVLTTEQFEMLEAEGRITQVNSMSPGEVAEVHYPDAGKLLVHRLGGFHVALAQRVDMELTDLEGAPLLHLDNVPFDAARGEVLVPCQRHFADMFPRDGVFRLEIVHGDRREELARYTVLHRL
jgi:Putative zinc-finger